MNDLGKYDDACTDARLKTDAEGVLLVVIGGHKGSGFSVQGSERLIAAIPNLLRKIAEEIEKETPVAMK